MDPKSEAKSDTKGNPNLRPFFSNVGIETVDLYNGSSRTHYRVHKNVLCTKIPYSNKMFNGGFSEASRNSAEFPEDAVGSFDVLLEWTYFQYHPLRPLNLDSPEPTGSNWNTIIRLVDIIREKTDFTADFLTAVRDQVRGGPKLANPSAGDGGIYHIHGERIGCSCSLNTENMRLRIEESPAF
ncbi:uncharacterized protein EAE97_005453 [Botrytis byssoidea]|uniref:BTB domain-containing protein n=1 Tax=Botrytis byssoidea TaxID=139641 RepID=A0A9P5M3A0_9HELO|nr:uncharacterized protein EAE97_005453 [Botrytis byssoidea]KAF7944820.1 hypothetical protein EAE97_005453 [Botrytis byssoidea]